MSHSLESLIRHLHQRRGRERRGLTLAEGVRLGEEVLAARVPVRAAVLAPALEATPRGRALADALRRTADQVETRSDRELGALAATDHPQGLILVIEPPRRALADLRVGPGQVALVLDAVQDPGNVGTMVRTAWALGAAGVIALPGTAELTNPKVLRSSMGGFFRLPALAARMDECLEWLRSHDCAVWVSSADGVPLDGTPGSASPDATPAARDGRPLALVVGNEGVGVGDALRGVADRRVSIRLRGDAESLNVAVAAGILLHEVLRDR